MQKIVKSNGILLPYILKSVILNIGICALLCIISSYIIFKFDLDESYYTIFGYLVVGITSFFTSLVSAKGFKNNLLILSVFSNIILIVITIVNSIIGKNAMIFIVNIAIILACSFLSSIINTKKSSKFKV